MEKVIYNSPKNKCGETTGSNCVQYNGDSLDCIGTCPGDTVSDVLKKLGQKECYIESLLDFSTLDLSCCYTPCPNCPKVPEKLIDVLQIMQNCICALSTRVLALESINKDLLAGVNPGDTAMTIPPPGF